MKSLKIALLSLIATGAQAQPQCADWLQHEMKKLHSSDTVRLCDLSAGKVALIVNTASQCGFTPQFEGLEKLYRQYKERGFVIIGFPSDSFFQEHDEAEKTAEVCYINYGVTFPMMESSSVLGKNANPVFKYLNATLGMPKWNFNKYLIDNKGTPVKHFGSRTAPDDRELIAAIETLLGQALE